ncbi:phage tail protein [Paenibacillus sp. sgz5001063]|uniref:phage tail protein n=1 Tax=Paenibacillus sp. sgz5001063 TaxID=3242474 RepID=UPI0036D43FC2
MTDALQSYDRFRKRIGILRDAYDITRVRRTNADYTLTFNVPMSSADFTDKLPLKGHVMDERGQYYVINSRQRNRDDRKLTALISCSHVMFKLADYKFPYASYIAEGYGKHITELTALIVAATGGIFSISVDDTFDLADVKAFGGGNCLEALNAVIDIYGAEVDPDNFTLHLRKKIGNAASDYRIALTRNLITAAFTDSASSLCTRLFAEMKDSRTWIGQPASILTADEQARLLAVNPSAISGGLLTVNYLISPYAAAWASDTVPFYDDLLTEQDATDPVKLLAAARLRLAEREVPAFEVSVSAADLFKIDTQEARPSLGDTVTLVDPALGLTNITARITEMTEYPYAPDKHTQLTVANVIRRDYTQIIADLEAGRRAIENVFSGGRIRAEAFEAFAAAAVKEINDSKTQVKYDTRGIVLQSTANANNLVLMTSDGIIVSTDGGATARTAITAAGIAAELIVGQQIIGVGLTIGSGNNITKITTNGISVGHADFNSAPFRVDMAGNTVLNKLTANSAQISTSNLNASTWQNGYFSGNITALGEITGGTITGALLRTAAGGQRIEMDTNSFRAVDAAGRIRVSISQTGRYGIAGTEYFDGAGTYKGGIYGLDEGFYIDSNNYMNLYAPVIAFNGNIRFQNATVEGIAMSAITGLSPTISDIQSSISAKANRNVSTGAAGPYNCGIPIGTVLKDANGVAYTWSGVPAHTHVQN